MNVFVLISIAVWQTFGHTCEDVCAEVESCVTSKKAQNSYCKYWQNPPVCFGLYFTDATYSKVCYQPNDPDCKEAYPVICHEH